MPKGPVIGPMVFAGVLIEEGDEKKLKDLGVKDSKLLAPEQREYLYGRIKEIIKDHVVIKVPAREIDELRKRINLNVIEAEKIAGIIKAMRADRAIVDSPQVSTWKFKDLLVAYAGDHTKITCENYADAQYPVCSAASIIAKVERDREIERIKKVVGTDFGVGYTHDPRTIAFVEECLREKKHLEFIRMSWVTVSDIRNKNEQKDLRDY